MLPYDSSQSPIGRQKRCGCDVLHHVTLFKIYVNIFGDGKSYPKIYEVFLILNIFGLLKLAC